jgi:hypothetical protein
VNKRSAVGNAGHTYSVGIWKLLTVGRYKSSAVKAPHWIAPRPSFGKVFDLSTAHTRLGP